jgi:hypothetical protein
MTMENQVERFRRSSPWLMALAVAASGCTAPMGSGTGSGSAGGKADGQGGQCPTEIARFDTWKSPEQTGSFQCDDQCKFKFKVWMDVPASLYEDEGTTVALRYKQQEEPCGSNDWFCDEDEALETKTETVKFGDGIFGADLEEDKKVDGDTQRVAAHWQFKTYSTQPVEVTPMLVRDGGEDLTGPTYRLELGKRGNTSLGMEPIYACESISSGLNTGTFFEIGHDDGEHAMADCAGSPGDEVPSRYTYDSRDRAAERQNFCVVAASSNPDVDSPEIKLHYRYDRSGDYRTVAAEPLFEERKNGYSARFRVDVSELDPFATGQCRGVETRYDDGRESTDMDYYVTVNGRRAHPAQDDSYVLTYQYRDRDPNGMYCDGSSRGGSNDGDGSSDGGDASDDSSSDDGSDTGSANDGWAVYDDAPGIPVEIPDAAESLHSSNRAFAPWCQDESYEGEDRGFPDANAGVGEAQADLRIPSDEGAAEEAHAVFTIDHHWHEDLRAVVRYTRPPEGGSAPQPVELEPVVMACDTSGQGERTFKVDVSQIAQHGLGGIWTVVVRDYGHDYSGYEGYESIQDFEIRAKR